jgi:hypothetical protein
MTLKEFKSRAYRLAVFPNREHVLKFEVFLAVKIHTAVFLVMTPCSLVGGYHRIGGANCLHRQGNPTYIFPLMRVQVPHTERCLKL